MAPLPVTAAPLDSTGRAPFLDALRGVALIGIGLMNVEWFTRPMQALGTGPAASDQGADRLLAWLVVVLVQGKFWVLFALLFGAGLAMQAGSVPAAVRLRRLLVLLVLGVAHALLLWPGDILHTYALAGLLLWLWPAHAQPVERQVASGTGLYMGMSLLIVLLGLMLLGGGSGAAGQGWIGDGAQAARIYAEGGWSEVTAQRLRDSLQLLQHEVVILPAAVGVCLLGMGLWRGGAWQERSAWPHRAAWPWLGACGLGLSVCGAWLLARHPDRLAWQVLAGAVLGLGALPLALAYVSGLWLLWQRQGWAATVMRRLAPFGRMSLTHYLGQSLVFAWVFHGYGLGMWGRLDRGAQLALVLAVVALQWGASMLWLRRFNLGPLEWLWRWASHGRRPALRR